ncbi:hypothetical protein GHK92_07585 [Nocardioides sp. dk4132]|uniref:hypothetical protein n=1 Tax=unclassified Nocardioides TaxID=2615069 RepID=UPI001294D5D2|nr:MULTISPECIES: hypothetical protein [unclassified Nocardioides]MQW75730.1 hypothetical protein [Nocardioides sp. dk4132]QGA08616.1 hypothetical protein GFH29_15335 [Nocardioides sp. dk884]
MPADGLTLAHGIGGAKDLPISPELAIAGAVAALVLSFTVLAVAWRTPRFDGPRSGRPVPRLGRIVLSTPFRVAARVLGMALFVFAAVAALFGENLLTNPIFGIFYVWWWVGLVPASFFLGPVWKAISPVRTINLLVARATGSDPDRGLFDYPARLGYWPAALGLFAFVWLELAYVYSTELGPVRLWCAAYVAIMLIGGALFGNTFYEKADPFEVYSTLVAKMSIWAVRDGQLVVRTPLSNLDSAEVGPGLVAVVSVLFGSTGYDSFRESTYWLKFIQNNETITTTPWLGEWIGTFGLLAMVLLVGLIFVVATMATGVLSDPEGGARGRWAVRRRLPNQFAHSIVPIIVGYIVAHYFTYLVEMGQLTLIQASDPLSNGSNLFGTGDWKVNYGLADHPTFIANLKVVAVVIGHVLGVISAHDRAVRLLPPRHQLTGQLPLLFAMVAFTAGGLYLLFAS